MRIALVTDVYAPQVSGIADSVASLASQLRLQGHQVRVYAPGKKAAGDIDVYRLPAWDVPGTAGGMSLVWSLGVFHDMAKFAPDVVHSHSFSTLGMAGLIAAWLLRVPMVGTDHTFPADYLHYLNMDKPLWRRTVRLFAAWYYNRCRAVTAPSDSMLAELRGHGLFRPHRVVSNPIVSDIFRPLSNRNALKQRHAIPPQAVLLFGRVALEKNLDVALSAFAHLARRRDVSLVVVGDGPAADMFRAAVAANGLSQRVIWKGLRRGVDLAEIINACDVYLITSHSETQSMTTLQAMACGVPVVAVRAGGLPEYVANGQTGLLVEPDDVPALAGALETILSSPDLAQKLALAARAKVAQYAPEIIAKTFFTLYRSAGAVITPLSPTLADATRGRD